MKIGMIPGAFPAAAAGIAASCGVARGQALAPLRMGNGGTSERYLMVAQPPGNTRDLMVLEKRGRIRLIRDGVTVTAPVLDLGSAANAGGEGGLLGIAFHPQFQSSGHVFLYYTGHRPGTTDTAGVHIIRYSLDPTDPSAVIPGSARPVMWIPRNLGGFHYGGWIGFGPGGYLYILSGDGRDPANAQPLDRLLGKVLRIDVDGDGFPADPLVNYAIPPSNPLAGSATSRQEIWASGVRNPWRGSIDRLTGDLWFGDVGEGTREEVNFQPRPGAPPLAARNYGWPCTEGTFCPGTPGCVCNTPRLTPPVYEYPHTQGVAVIGGYVYRGAAIPELSGAYFFGDYNGRIWHMRYGAGGATEFTERTAELGMTERIGWGEGSDGELYYCGRNGTGGYHVAKIVRACPANCDGSSVPPVLDVNDFVCFQNRYAAGSSLANCDGSTAPPVLNINDFVCFQRAYAAGCP